MEHVVSSVKNSLLASNLWTAARSVVDVVASEGDGVLRAVEEDGPVVVVVAGGGPGGGSGELGVGDGDAAGSGAARGRGKHLASDEGELDVVDPNVVGAVSLDGVSSPDVLWVEVGDVDVPDLILE